MHYAVNLVPTQQVRAQVRLRRRARWLVVCLTAATLVAAGWVAQRPAARAVNAFGERAHALEVQRSEVQRRMVAAAAQRNQFVEQLRTLCAARRPQPWPERLARLTRESPEGIFLTQLLVSDDSDPATRAPPVGNPGVSPSPDDLPAAGVAQTVRLLGYASDHTALLQLLNTLQGLPDWQNVELVRATLEPYGGGLAVAFEFNCRTRDSADGAAPRVATGGEPRR